MKNETSSHSSLFQVLKAVVVVIVMTVVLVLLLSFLLYKFHFPDKFIRIGIFIIYVLANFIGGFIIGKIRREKKFLWGLCTGIVYFVLLFILSCIFQGGFAFEITNLIISLLCCLLGGILGGMLA